MSSYIIRRLIQSIFVLVGVTFIVFFAMHLSGDPVRLMLPSNATREQVEQLRESMGFNDPIWQQYYQFLKGAVRGDFGDSFYYNKPVTKLILERLPATIQMGLLAQIFALSIAFPVGIFVAIRRNTIYDLVATSIALSAQSIPSFWMGLMLIWLFAVILGWLPVSGSGSWQHVILPALTLSMFTMGRVLRLVRSGMLEVLNADYVRTARSKGLIERVVIYKHALRNALIPIITVIGLQIGAIVGGAFITEVVFAWPGLGRLTVEAIKARDFPIVQGAVFYISLSIVILNLLIDIVYTIVDPRIRYE